MAASPRTSSQEFVARMSAAHPGASCGISTSAPGAPRLPGLRWLMQMQAVGVVTTTSGSHPRRRELDVGVLPGLGESGFHVPGLGFALLRAQALRETEQRPAVVGIALQFLAVGGF